jgi:hypothetical protein
MLDTLITNKTRLKLLLRFFLDPEAKSYLRGLAEEFGESTNAIRIELNRFEAAGLLVSWGDKNKKMFSANSRHPLFGDIQSILRKHTGIDTIVTKVISKLGHIESAYLKDMTARNFDQSKLELFLFGDPIDQNYLLTLLSRATSLINRKITCTALSVAEEKKFLENNPDVMLVWKNKI